MERTFAILGSLYGLLGVGFGAFGAHALQNRLPPADLATFEVAVRYQMYHALALLFVALVVGRTAESGMATWAGWSFAVGTLIFSGSLYLLVLTGPRSLGAITPIGGVALLAGWALLALHFLRTA